MTWVAQFIVIGALSRSFGWGHQILILSQSCCVKENNTAFLHRKETPGVLILSRVGTNICVIATENRDSLCIAQDNRNL